MFSNTRNDQTAAERPRRRFSYANVMSTVSVFLVVAGGTALAASLPANSVTSKTVKDNKLKSVDLKDGKGVAGLDVIDASLTGDDLAPNSVSSAKVAANSLTADDLAANSVNSQEVVDASITADDLAPNSVSSAKVADNSLTGEDVDESTLGQVPDAATLQGRGPTQFLSSAVYKRESAFDPGTTLGDGTQVASQACDPGDVLLSGGPASINANTDLLESFPTPGTTNSWSARVNKNGGADNWVVVVLCVDQ